MPALADVRAVALLHRPCAGPGRASGPSGAGSSPNRRADFQPLGLGLRAAAASARLRRPRMKLSGNGCRHSSLLYWLAWLDFRSPGSGTRRFCIVAGRQANRARIRGSGNPACPPNAKRSTKRTSILRLARPHRSHRRRRAVARATGAPVVACSSSANYFQSKGPEGRHGMGIGGTIEVEGLDHDDAGRPLERVDRRRHDDLSRQRGRFHHPRSKTVARSTSPATRRSSATCG